MWTIPILNGPNLNLTGVRETEIYGIQNFENFYPQLRQEFSQASFPDHQTNCEAELIDLLHAYRKSADAIILNPGGYTHTSIAIRDAVAAMDFPVAEVHLSELSSRESFRQKSLIRDVCYFHISGCGMQCYRMAAMRLLEYLKITQTGSLSKPEHERK
ncbi:MAG: 3-dehydroquinate dehydratase [Saprospiraceae bacterium]|nr:3-dehydroquinate dehydratase [Saprospiraceae bacterium]